MPNPYTWRSVVRDPNMFYGRKREVAEIISRLSGSMPLNISVIGPRRIGKSSLLWHISQSSSDVLPQEVCERCTFVYIDFQEAGKLSTPKLLRWVLREVDTQFDLSMLDEDGLKDILQERLASLKQTGKNLILVFDEFDSAVRYISAETLDYLRALAKYNLAYIVATKQPLSEICTTLESSPFSNIFTVFPFGLLPWQEAYSLVMEPSAQQGVIFTDKDVEFILDAAGCHPYLIQVLSFYTFESRINHTGSLDYSEIERQAASDVMPFIQRTFYGLSETTKEAVLGMLGRQRPPLPVFDELKGIGIIGEDGDLFCSLFKRFLRAVAEREQDRSYGSLTEDVDKLLKQLEQQMREFLEMHLETKYGPNWPKNLQKRSPSKFQGWLQRMPDEAQSDTSRWQKILRYSDFAEPFEIIRSYEWGDLKGAFPFSKDANKSKRSLEERQEFLTKARNAFRHHREDDLTLFELEKARLFCNEMLAMIEIAVSEG